MYDSYPRMLKTDERDAAQWRPQGWKGKFYKLFNPLRFTRKELHLSGDLFMVRTDFLEGHIRIGGRIDPGALCIGFYESSEGNRLSGTALITRRMTVSYNGCKWDAVSKSPACGLVIHFSPTLAKRIVSKSAHDFLMKAPGPAGERLSLILAVTPMGENLRAAIRSSIELAEDAENSRDYENVGSWISDDLVSLATCLIDEITEEDCDSLTSGESNRYSLAREVEEFLWRDPTRTDGNTPTSLDEFATHFGCSRRLVQIAIQEHFGVGFTALKRSIRLHQVHSVLNNNDYKSITSAAMDFEFDHLGRFAQYYKKMFGALPSESFRKNSSALASAGGGFEKPN